MLLFIQHKYNYFCCRPPPIPSGPPSSFGRPCACLLCEQMIVMVDRWFCGHCLRTNRSRESPGTKDKSEKSIIQCWLQLHAVVASRFIVLFAPVILFFHTFNSVKQVFKFLSYRVCVLLFLQRQNWLFVFWEWGITDFEPETGLDNLWRLLSDSSKGAGRWMCVDFQYSGNTFLVLISDEQICVNVCLLHLYSKYMYGSWLGPKRREKKISDNFSAEFQEINAVSQTYKKKSSYVFSQPLLWYT